MSRHTFEHVPACVQKKKTVPTKKRGGHMSKTCPARVLRMPSARRAHACTIVDRCTNAHVCLYTHVSRHVHTHAVHMSVHMPMPKLTNPAEVFLVPTRSKGPEFAAHRDRALPAAPGHGIRRLCTCLYTCLHTHVSTHICTYVHTRVCTRVYARVSPLVYAHV